MSILPPNNIVLSRIRYFLEKKLGYQPQIIEPDKRPQEVTSKQGNQEVVLVDNPEKGKVFLQEREEYPHFKELLQLLGPWPLFKITNTYRKVGSFTEEELNVDNILYITENDRKLYTLGPSPDIDVINFTYARIKKAIKDIGLTNGIVTILIHTTLDDGNSWQEFHYDRIEITSNPSGVLPFSSYQNHTGVDDSCQNKSSQ
jgi:hypothetical protein